MEQTARHSSSSTSSELTALYTASSISRTKPTRVSSPTFFESLYPEAATHTNSERVREVGYLVSSRIDTPSRASSARDALVLANSSFDASSSKEDVTELKKKNWRLEEEVAMLKREAISHQTAEETLKARASHLVRSLADANRRVEEQRRELDEWPGVKADLQERLRSEYEHREKDLVAKFQEERDAACELVRQEMNRRIKDREKCLREWERKWTLRSSGMEEDHRLKLRALEAKYQDQLDEMETQRKGREGRGLGLVHEMELEWQKRLQNREFQMAEELRSRTRELEASVTRLTNELREAHREAWKKEEALEEHLRRQKELLRTEQEQLHQEKLKVRQLQEAKGHDTQWGTMLERTMERCAMLQKTLEEQERERLGHSQIRPDDQQNQIMEQLRTIFHEQQRLMESGMKSREFEVQKMLEDERDQARREMQQLKREMDNLRSHSNQQDTRLEHKCTEAELETHRVRAELQSKLNEAEAEARQAKAERDTIEDRMKNLETTLRNKEAKWEYRSKDEFDRMVDDAHREAKAKEERLREWHSAEMDRLRKEWDSEKEHLERQLDRERLEAKILEAKLMERDNHQAEKESEYMRIKEDVMREHERNRKDKEETLTQISNLLGSTTTMEAKYHEQILQIEQTHAKLLKEQEAVSQRDKQQALQKQKLEWQEDVLERQKIWDDTRRALEREWKDAMATREMEFTTKLKQYTEDSFQQTQKLRKDRTTVEAEYEEKMRHFRSQWESKESQLKSQFEARIRDLQARAEKAEAEARECDANFAKLEKQLKEQVMRLSEQKSRDISPSVSPSIGLAMGHDPTLAARLAEADREIERLTQDRDDIFIKAKQLGHQCASLKERIRVLEGDVESQRMYPLLGIEITEGNVLGDQFRNGGVDVLTVRGPAEKAGVYPGDLIQHVEVHHTAVIHDLYDFRQAVDKVRPGDIVTATVLRGGIRRSHPIEVQASFTDPYKRYPGKRRSPTPTLGRVFG